MERNVAQLRMEVEHIHSGRGGEDFACQECGKRFETPLLAQVSSHGSVEQSYYACPRCLTQVHESKRQRTERSDSPASFKEEKRSPLKSEENAGCQHFLGYLKQRPKGSSIPEDCLVCDKMIECMVK